MKRTIFVFHLSLIFLAMSPWSQGYCQEKFPNRPITVIVAFEAGAGTDLSARMVGKYSEKFLGQPIIIKNRPGGAGTIGANEGVFAPADGYTLVVASPSIIITPYTVKDTPKYIKMFDPICMTAGAPAVLTVSAESPWKTFKEFIDYAKKNPEKIRMSNSAHGGVYHLGSVALQSATGVKFTHVPFKGTTSMVMALLGGHVEAQLSTLASVYQYVKTGKLRVLATGTPQRYAVIPEVPTYRELGVNTLDVSTWWGWVAPKGTPRKNINILADAVKRGMDTPEMRRQAVDEQLWVLYNMGPEQSAKFLEDQDKQWNKIITEMGLNVNVVK